MNGPLEPMKANCKTCPFRADGWTQVRELLTERAVNEGTPVCHSTGPKPLSKRVSKKPLACRGARDLQLQMFHSLGVIEAPTDEAWAKKVAEMGL